MINYSDSSYAPVRKALEEVRILRESGASLGKLAQRMNGIRYMRAGRAKILGHI